MSLHHLHSRLVSRPADAVTSPHVIRASDLHTARCVTSALAGPSGRGMVSTSAAAVAEAPLTDKKVRRPDQQGRFGQFGGKYVPETLISALHELEEAYDQAQRDNEFKVLDTAVDNLWCSILPAQLK